MAKATAGARVREHVRARGWTRIGGEEWSELRGAFAGVSDETLRKHAVGSGVEVAQPWRGVDSSSLEELERTLTDLAAAYFDFPKLARATVIAAKDKARFAARNRKAAAGKRALKQEMVDWMLVWLGDPRMFADWAKLRRAQLRAALL